MNASTREPIVPALRGRGIALAAAGLIATAIVAVCTVNAFGRIGKGFPGFFVWENLFVPAVGESYWTGAASGLRYHSWVLRVDGRAVGNAGELDRILAERAPGDRVEYTLEKEGERYSITVPMMKMDLRAWSSVLGVYIFQAIALLALGLIVVYMKPYDAAAVALCAFSVNLALYIATSADLFGPYVFRVPYFFFINLIPVTACAVLSHFPLARRRHAWEDRALWALALAGLGLGIASNVAFFGSRTALISLDAVTHILVASSSFGAILFFTWHFFRARQHGVRQRTKVVMFGTAVAFLLPSVMLPVIYARGLSIPFNFLAVSIVAFPLGIGYAIAKHDLFDIDRVIKRALVYFALSALVIGIYTITITSLDYVFESLTGAASRLAEGLLILLLILVTAPSRRRIQDLVDRIYDRRPYSYREVIRSASRSFTTVLDFEELILQAVTLIDATVQPELVRVYQVRPDGAAMLRGGRDHRPDATEPERAAPATEPDRSLEPLVRALERSDLVTDEVDPGERDPLRREGSRCLAETGGSLATAMRLEGRLVGMIVVGRKRAGGHHTSEDVELLRTISDQLAIALENARARDELVRRERLAVIGELSGAVAHAMRNPLAGIKAAAQLALFELDGHAATPTVSDIVSETDRLNERITALLDFSRPFTPDPRPVSLNEIASQAVRDTRPKAAEKRIEVVTEEEDHMPQVRVDPILLEQAVAELISNAIDAGPEGSRVVVRTGHGTEGPASRVWLEVRDVGPGIDPERAETLFDLFYTTKPRGTGFGLATVRKIAEGHGGTVTARNRDGGGACFRIVLPVQAPEHASA